MFFDYFFRLPFLIRLRTFFLVFMGLCLALGYYYAQSQNESSINGLARNYIDQLNRNIIETTTSELIPAVQLTESSARLTEEGTISYSNPAQMDRYLQGTLKTYPQLNAIYFGDKLGNFYMVKRLSNGNKQLKLLVRSMGMPMQTTKTFTSTGILISTATSPMMDYDPRNRPWFVGARTLEQRFWTDVYVFYTGNIPGVSAAFPALDQNKQFYGAFGIDIDLGKISKLLRNNKLTPNARLFILDHNNTIVAHPDMEYQLSRKTGTLAPLHISDIEDPVIKVAFQTYDRLQVGIFNIIVNKKEYIVSIKPFPEYFGQKWNSVMIVSKKDALAQSSGEKHNKGMWLIGLLLLGLYASTFIKRNITAPLRNGALQHSSSIIEIKDLS